VIRNNSSQKIVALLFASLAIIAMVVCAAGAIFTPFGIAARSEKENIEKLHKLGVPRTPEEMSAKYPVPQTDNGAAELKLILNEFDLLDIQFKKISPVYRYFDPKQYRNIDRLKRQQVTLTLNKLDKLKKFSSYKFYREYSKTFAIQYPEYKSLKNAVFFLCLDARSQFDSGEIQIAVDRLKKALSLSDISGDEPIFIAKLIQITTRQIIQNSIVSILYSKNTPRAFVDTVKEINDTCEENLNLRDVFICEAFMGIYFTRNQFVLPTTDTDQTDSDRMLRRLSSIPFFNRANRSELAASYAQLIEAYDSGKNELDSLRLVNITSQKIESKKGLHVVYSAILLPLTNELETARIKILAKYRTTKQLIAIREQMNSSGKLPSQLPLKGDSSIDPFTNQPLVFKYAKGQVSVYSFGPDKKDNGGLFIQENKQQDIGGMISLE
jgi:hypothetical protein